MERSIQRVLCLLGREVKHMKRLISSLLVLGLVLCPYSEAFAAWTPKIVRDVGASGTLTGGATTFAATLKKVSDNSACTAMDFSGTTADPTVESNCYVDMAFEHSTVFDDNADGKSDFTVILDFTNNRDATANPKYIGTGSGVGVVGKVAKDRHAPIHQVVLDEPKVGGYTFRAYDPNNTPIEHKGGRTKPEPIDTRNQFFLQDLRQDEATFPVKPFDPGFASMVVGLSGKDASLPNAPEDATPADLSDDNDPGPDGIVGTSDDQINKGPNRLISDGDAALYAAVNYTSQPSQEYAVSTWQLALSTIT